MNKKILTPKFFLILFILGLGLMFATKPETNCSSFAWLGCFSYRALLYLGIYVFYPIIFLLILSGVFIYDLVRDGLDPNQRNALISGGAVLLGVSILCSTIFLLAGRSDIRLLGLSRSIILGLMAGAAVFSFQIFRAGSYGGRRFFALLSAIIWTVLCALWISVLDLPGEFQAAITNLRIKTGYCSGISDEHEKGRCELTQILDKGDATKCEQIFSENYKEDCYAGFAALNSDPGLCDKIENAYAQSGCFWNLARKTKNPGYCRGSAFDSCYNELCVNSYDNSLKQSCKQIKSRNKE